ncbi:MAG: hypothetical protein DMG58_28310 [Acidobacteria bacterium]|nr:MAG: hypothetical protein DMG58_28310 [Acidobacteriota bacterium]
MRILLLLMALPLLADQTYYVDCVAGSDLAAGTSHETSWKTVGKVSAKVFAPGDSILFRRGTRCGGMLWPKGSGQPGTPIRLGAYGTGALPVIEAANTDETAIKLFNQQHWQVENLEAVGGNRYGVLVSGTEGTLRQFRLTNLVVHDVTGAAKTKTSGLVVVAVPPEVTLEDVVIDGITAFGTTQWAGIVVAGGSRENRIRKVSVRNSVVHNVYGDGIVLFQVEDGVVEKSAVWLTGLQPTVSIGTPNGIWTWRCRTCTVQWTEGFFTDSPGVDGGVYDIDWGNDDNLVQYNYGHDAQGYCASVFGAHEEITTNSVIRYNVCVNNGRSPKLAQRQGDLYISTWEDGALDGVLVHNNTLYWNPPVNAPALQMDHADFKGAAPNLFSNNVIISSVPSMIHASRRLEFKRNVYWYRGRGPASWTYGEPSPKPPPDDSFVQPCLDEQLRPRPGSSLINAAWRLPKLSASEVLGAPHDGGSDIGAIEFKGPAPQPVSAPKLEFRADDGQSTSLVRRNGKWLLLVVGDLDDEARSQLVFIQTALAQYGHGDLEAALAIRDAPGNLRYDWNLGGIRLLNGAGEARNRLRISQSVAVLLVSPESQVVRAWDGFAAPAELGLALKRYLGPPPGSPALVVH